MTTTDHSIAVQCLRNAARRESSYGNEQRARKLYAAAIALNRLEALTTEPTITINEAAENAAMQRLKDLYNLCGDALGCQCATAHLVAYEMVINALGAVYAAQNPEGDTHG